MPVETRRPDLREPQETDLDWILALNKRFEAALSPLDRPGLIQLMDQAFHCRVTGEDPAGFLIALRPGAAYDSPNYLWFSERYSDFAYVDRIVTDPAHRGRGVGRAFYEDLFNRVAALGLGRVCCEVNAEPPNPGSDAFHAALGFQMVGKAILAGKDKRVRYFVREVS